MERVDTAKVCALLKASFPVWNTTPETIEMYHFMLKDIPTKVVMRAVQDWILSEEKFPTIAGIRNKCAEVADVLAPTATEAWAEVWKAVSESGRLFYRYGGTWSHEVLIKTMEIITLGTICDTPTENLSTIRSQFTKAYNDNKKSWDTQIIRSQRFELGAEIVALPNSTMVQSQITSRKALTESGYIND